MNDDWSQDIEVVLEKIRINSVILSNYHKKRYFILKENLKYYRLPVIVISGVNSIVSVGLQPYLKQSTISIMTCLLALICSIIGSIELYLMIQKSMEIEMISQRDYYLLSIDIYKVLSLGYQHRPIPAKEYLEKCYNTYCKLIENSNTVCKKIEDSLVVIPVQNIRKIESSSSFSDIEMSPK